MKLDIEGIEEHFERYNKYKKHSEALSILYYLLFCKDGFVNRHDFAGIDTTFVMSINEVNWNELTDLFPEDLDV